jgi:hypothetical protein
LVTHAEQTLKHICKSVVVPNVAETVDLTSDTSIFKLRLKDTLLDSLDFVQVGDYELAYVDGRLIAPPQPSGIPLPPSSSPHHTQEQYQCLIYMHKRTGLCQVTMQFM